MSIIKLLHSLEASIVKRYNFFDNLAVIQNDNTIGILGK
jgi:hypothetical protein